jgi:hypothetical protein
LNDGLLIALVIAAFFFLTWFRRHGIFWDDEIMGWTTLIQPTWPQLIRVWWSGVDSSGLWFYVFARPWLQIFGWTELSLHLWSAFFVGLSFLVTWVCARRYASLLTVAFFTPLIYLGNRQVAVQLCNGRCYGIVLLAVAVASYALLRTDPAEPDFRGARPALLSFLGFLLLTGSHMLGMLFWGVFVAGFCLRDLALRVFQWKVYLGALVALSLVVPISWRNIQSTINMGKPVFWTSKPTLSDFLLGFGDYSAQVTLLLAVLLLVFLGLFFRQPASARGPLVPQTRISIYCLLLVFPSLCLLMFALSLLGKSIYIDRYLIPVIIGNVLILCELMTRIELLKPFSRSVRWCFAGFATVLIGGLFVFNLHRQGLPGQDTMGPLLQALPAGKPVVITDTGLFIVTIYYYNNDLELVTPTDWSIQLDPDYGSSKGGGGASYLHEMEDWKAMGIYADHILSTQQLLGKYRSFVVISNREHTLWFRRYIANNPAYRSEELPSSKDVDIWSVETR